MSSSVKAEFVVLGNSVVERSKAPAALLQYWGIPETTQPEGADKVLVEKVHSNVIKNYGLSFVNSMSIYF